MYVFLWKLFCLFLNLLNEIFLRNIFNKVLIDSCDDEYKINDYVYHNVFGTGKVISIEKSVIKVAFKMPYGIKILMTNHPSLHKIDE